MPTEPKPDQFVAHLRLINFSLLITSIGLMVAVTQTSETQYDRAIKDLSVIRGLADDNLSGQIRELVNEQSKSLPQGSHRPEPFYVPVFNSYGPFLCRGSADVHYSFPRNLRTKIPALAQRGEPKLPSDAVLLPAGRDRMETLADFRQVWDYFVKTPLQLFLIKSLSRDATVRDTKVNSESAKPDSAVAPAKASETIGSLSSGAYRASVLSATPS